MARIMPIFANAVKRFQKFFPNFSANLYQKRIYISIKATKKPEKSLCKCNFVTITCQL